MATLTPTLTLASTDASSDTLNFTVTDSLTVADSGNVGLSRATITTSDNQELVDEATSGVYYFYAKNLDSTNLFATTNINAPFTILTLGKCLNKARDKISNCLVAAYRADFPVL